MLLPYRAKNPPERFPYATIGLIVLNVVVYVLTTHNFGFGGVRDSAVGALAVSHTTLSPWRLLTSMFLHEGLLHIAGNMLFLWIFGAAVEGRLGPVKFIGLYLIAGMAGGLLSDVITFASNPDTPSLGASGAIMGLAGAYLYIFPYSSIRVAFLFFGAGVRNWQARWVILYYVGFDIVNWLSFRGEDGVGHFAHLGGVAAGFLTAMLIRAKRDAEDVSEAQAVRADVKDPDLLSLPELDSLMQRPSVDSRIVIAYCDKALLLNSGEQLCLAALQKHAHVLIQQANSANLANVALRLSLPAAQQMSSVFFLRLGSRAEQASQYDYAVAIYKRIYEMAPQSQDAEAALFRTGRLLERIYGDRRQAVAYYHQVLKLFPEGQMAPQVRNVLIGLGEAAPSSSPMGLPLESPNAALALPGAVRYDLAGNPLD